MSIPLSTRRKLRRNSEMLLQCRDRRWQPVVVQDKEAGGLAACPLSQKEV